MYIKVFRKGFSKMILMLLLIGSVALLLSIHPVKAPNGTLLYIYIRADGSIDPPDAPIHTTDNVTYRIFDNIINRSIIIERDNIILRGFNHIVQGNESLKVGINLTGRTNVTIEDVRINGFYYGVLLNSSVDCKLYSNTMWKNFAGIWAEGSLRTEISHNNVSYNNFYGIRIYSGGNNELFCNTVWFNYYGINIWYSGADTLLDNNVSLNWATGILLHYSIGGTWLSNNNVSSNGDYGIFILESDTLKMNNNKASNNEHNFGVDGTTHRNFATLTIDTTNKVNGKPIYYVKGATDTTYSSDTNAGTIYLIDCNNVTVKDLNLTENGCGLFMLNTTKSRAENISVSRNTCGIDLRDSYNNTIVHSNITNNQYGMRIEDSNETEVCQNTIVNNQWGIFMNASRLNCIYGNLISHNSADGIQLQNSHNNTVIENTIAENGELFPFPEPFYFGIKLQNSENNTIYHNNFLDNGGQAEAISSNNNKWDNGWPSGGNYWSDHNNTDVDSDGIADQVYEIKNPNIDSYPLAGMFSALKTPPYKVEIVCNSTIKHMNYYPTNNTIAITVSNSTSTQTHGFCRLTIPHEAMTPPYNVTVDGKPVDYEIVFENETLSIIYFTYQHSTLEIVVIPENSTLTTISLILILTSTLTLIKIIKKKRKQNP